MTHFIISSPRLLWLCVHWCGRNPLNTAQKRQRWVALCVCASQVKALTNTHPLISAPVDTYAYINRQNKNDRQTEREIKNRIIARRQTVLTLRETRLQWHTHSLCVRCLCPAVLCCGSLICTDSRCSSDSPPVTHTHTRVSTWPLTPRRLGQWPLTPPHTTGSPVALRCVVGDMLRCTIMFHSRGCFPQQATWKSVVFKLIFYLFFA